MDRTTAEIPQRDEIAELLPRRASALAQLFMIRSRIEVPRTELGVMFALREQPRRITELAAQEGVTQPAMTLLVNRLEQRGWVDRRADPSDGRAVLACLTELGHEVIDRVRAEYRALLHEEMAALDDSDVEILGKAIEILEGLAERLEERSR